MKRRRAAEVADENTCCLGFNSDGFGTRGFSYEFSDENSVNRGPDQRVPAAPAAPAALAAAMPAAYWPNYEDELYVPYYKIGRSATDFFCSS